MDALKLLKSDHKEVNGWFKDFEKSDDETERQTLARNICHALMVHAQIEEEIFYPAVREACVDGGLIDEANVEHATAKELIAQIEKMAPNEPLFAAKVKVLGEYVRHHVKEEEDELFPEIRDSKMPLNELGAQLAARKSELMNA